MWVSKKGDVEPKPSDFLALLSLSNKYKTDEHPSVDVKGSSARKHGKVSSVGVHRRDFGRKVFGCERYFAESDCQELFIFLHNGVLQNGHDSLGGSFGRREELQATPGRGNQKG